MALPLRAPPDQHATIVSRGFAPGDDTGYHVHDCGHEIVCVLGGSLTMEYPGEASVETASGEAIYVAPGVVHRGVNAAARSRCRSFMSASARRLDRSAQRVGFCVVAVVVRSDDDRRGSAA